MAEEKTNSSLLNRNPVDASLNSSVNSTGVAEVPHRKSDVTIAIYDKVT